MMIPTMLVNPRKWETQPKKIKDIMMKNSKTSLREISRVVDTSLGGIPNMLQIKNMEAFEFFFWKEWRSERWVR